MRWSLIPTAWSSCRHSELFRKDRNRAHVRPAAPRPRAGDHAGTPGRRAWPAWSVGTDRCRARWNAAHALFVLRRAAVRRRVRAHETARSRASPDVRRSGIESSREVARLRVCPNAIAPTTRARVRTRARRRASGEVWHRGVWPHRPPTGPDRNFPRTGPPSGTASSVAARGSCSCTGRCKLRRTS